MSSKDDNGPLRRRRHGTINDIGMGPGKPESPWTAGATRARARASVPTLRRSGRLAFLEHRGLEAVPLQQLVELRPVPLSEQGGLGHVAAGDLE